ncbi:MAG TPA: HIT domain-containing protein [Propionibacteriaceae bacterium]|jgi:histidine triad (HIT) family protein|nr:HIT domain-containing protein [Propionibacteriaceae bacterium]
MTDCIFCKIVAGDIPSRGVYSDDHAYAFLDLAPWHPGHSLVVPRRHVPDLITTDHALTEIAPAVDAVARLLVERLDADGVNVVSSSGAAAGQEVFHLHVHVVPRYADEPGLRLLVNPAPTPDSELDAVHRRITEPQ